MKTPAHSRQMLERQVMGFTNTDFVLDGRQKIGEVWLPYAGTIYDFKLHVRCAEMEEPVQQVEAGLRLGGRSIVTFRQEADKSGEAGFSRMGYQVFPRTMLEVHYGCIPSCKLQVKFFRFAFSYVISNSAAHSFSALEIEKLKGLSDA